jgi:hypothetical protein
MGKSAKKRPADADFAAPKRRVGKRAPTATNTTATVFKSKAVILPEQLALARAVAHAESDGTVATSARQLALPDLLMQLSHHSPAVRKDALFGLRDLSERNPGALATAAARVLDGCLTLLVDGDGAVRAQLILLLKCVAETLGAEALRPFAPLLLLRFTAALSHSALAVRCDGARAASALLPALARAHVAALASAPVGAEAGEAGGGVRAQGLAALLPAAVDFVRATALGPDALTRAARDARVDGAQLLQRLLAALDAAERGGGGGGEASGEAGGELGGFASPTAPARAPARPSLPGIDGDDGDLGKAAERAARSWLERSTRARLVGPEGACGREAAAPHASAETSAAQILTLVAQCWQSAEGASGGSEAGSGGGGGGGGGGAPTGGAAAGGGGGKGALGASGSEYLAAVAACGLSAHAALLAAAGAAAGAAAAPADANAAGLRLASLLPRSRAADAAAATDLLCVMLGRQIGADRGAAADGADATRAALRERSWLLAARLARAPPPPAVAAGRAAAEAEAASRAAALSALGCALSAALVAELDAQPRGGASGGAALARAVRAAAELLATPAGGAPAAARARGGGGGGGGGGAAARSAAAALVDALLGCAERVAAGRPPGAAPAAAGGAEQRAQLRGGGAHALFQLCALLSLPHDLRAICAAEGGGADGGGGGAARGAGALPLAPFSACRGWLLALPRCVWEAGSGAPALTACALACMRAHVLAAPRARGADAAVRADARDALGRGLTPFFAVAAKGAAAVGHEGVERGAPSPGGGALDGERVTLLFGPFCARARGGGAERWAAARRAAIALVCALPELSARLCVALGACARHVALSGSGDERACVLALAAACARAPPADSRAPLAALVAAALAPRAFGFGDGGDADAAGEGDDAAADDGEGARVTLARPAAPGPAHELGHLEMKAEAAVRAHALRAAAAAAEGAWAARADGAVDPSDALGAIGAPAVCRAHLDALAVGCGRRRLLADAVGALAAVGDGWGRDALCAELGPTLCGAVEAPGAALPTPAALTPLKGAAAAPPLGARAGGPWAAACAGLSQEEAIVDLCAALAPPHGAGLPFLPAAANDGAAAARGDAGWARLSERGVRAAVALLSAPCAPRGKRRAAGAREAALEVDEDDADTDRQHAQCARVARATPVARLLLAAPALAAAVLDAIRGALEAATAEPRGGGEEEEAARGAHCLLRCVELHALWASPRLLACWAQLARAAAAVAREPTACGSLRAACEALCEGVRTFGLALAVDQL